MLDKTRTYTKAELADECRRLAEVLSDPSELTNDTVAALFELANQSAWSPDREGNR
jgi:hypothetical protein